ncbi:MAG TPA: hypothetical protein VFC31_06965 [Candidatus Limnocylindria bacterium]|nr:hypothetical protein [Candidatus Limnocylindria bacterium]
MSVVETGITVVAPDATACPLCAAHEARPARARADRSDTLFPWVLALTVATVVASVGVGSDRWFGLGSIAGLIAGATLAVVSVRRAVAGARATGERAIAALNEEADTRVGMVIRQFEWAVNDLATLKRELDRAEVTANLLVVEGRGRERHIKKLERQLAEANDRLGRLSAFARAAEAGAAAVAETAGGALPFRWGLHHDGAGTRLELDCDVRYPATRIRVIDRAGMTTLTSMTAMHSGSGTLCFALADPPQELVADLEAGREPSYRLQVLADGDWRPVRLEDSGRRTRLVTDKQGRLYRVNELVLARRPAVAFNPFDGASDGSLYSL